MSTDFDGKLTYRDYVAHIFTGVIFNVFLLAALFPVLPDKWWEYDLNNELIWSLLAIPILFLEGHLILATNRFFIVEIYKFYFYLRVKHLHRKHKKNRKVVLKYNEGYDRKIAYRKRMRWQNKLFNEKRFLFFLLLSTKTSARKVVRENMYGNLVMTAKKGKIEAASQYYVLSDFFKGVGCAAVISIIVAASVCNCWVVGAMFLIIFLSRQRARYYSMLYVRYRYKKKDTEEEPIEKING